MSGPAITRIYVVRHGETDWNRARRLQGTIDTSLNPIGLDQARRAASWFGKRPVSHVVTSPLARARQTAVSIARGGGYAMTIDPALIEIDHGSWAGLTVTRIARTSPGAVSGGHLRPDALDASGGETIDMAYWRACRALRRLLSAPPAGAIVVVSHGVTNALLICAAMGKTPARIDEHLQPNGFVHLLCFRRRTLINVEGCPLVDRVPGGSSCCPPWSTSE